MSQPESRDPSSAFRDDTRAMLRAVEDTLRNGSVPEIPVIPDDPEAQKKLEEILAGIVATQQFALAMAQGDLSHDLAVRGHMAGSLKALQSSLRHLTWQAGQIAGGDLSQRVDFMGEFSDSFNAMVEYIAEDKIDRDQREEELRRVNSALFKEIAERKAIEEKIRLQNQIFETIAEGINLVRSGDGVIIYTNSKFERMFGYEHGELTGKHISVVNAPAEKMSPEDTAKEIMRVLGSQGTWRGELKNIKKDGTPFWCLAVISTFEHPEFGKVWISAHTDITARKSAEEFVRKSFAILKGVVESPKDVVIFALDRQYRYTAFNENHRRTMKQIWGADIALGNSMLDYIRAPKDRGKAVVNFDRALAGESFSVIEDYGDTAFERRWYEDVYNPVTDENGHVIGLTLFLTDITERKTAGEALKESEQKFRDIFNNTSDAILLHEIGNNESPGRFIDVNAIAFRMLGYTREELFAKTPLEITTDYHNPPVEKILEDQRTTGRARFETEYRAKDGTIIPVEINTQIVTIQGKKLMLGAARDITERKQSEEKIKKAQLQVMEHDRFLQHLIDTIPNPIFSKNRDGIYTGCNTAFERYIGIPKDQLVGKSVYDIAPKELADIYFASDRTLLENPGTQIYESRVKYADGSLHEVIFNKATFTDLIGNTDGIVGVMIDITERKKMEDALRQANKKITMLSSITRHDIRNQLMALRGYLELSRLKINDPVVLEYMKKEDHAAEAIGTQIEFTKFYEDIGVNAPEWLDIPWLVQSARSQLSPPHTIEVITDIPPVKIFADRLIERVFYNLMENTLRHGERVSRIRFSFRETDRGAEIVYEDDGVGISDEDKPHLFQKGFGKNTGLGLFLSQEILAITSLTIRETGEPGKGVRFVIAVPKDGYRLSGKK